MPVDDDFVVSSRDGRGQTVPTSTTTTMLSSASSLSLSRAEARKSNKPFMEKKRRARINRCLNELKALILEAMKKDPARHSKIEKADILEMTVQHLKNVQETQLAFAVSTDPTVLQRFKLGFSECAEEVSRYVNCIDGMDSSLKHRLLNHISSSVSNVQKLSSPCTIVNSIGFPPALNQHLKANGISSSPNHLFDVVSQAAAEDVNNNHQKRLLGGFQLIPSRLPSGEIAFVIPKSSQVPPTLLPYVAADLQMPSHSNGSSLCFHPSDLKAKDHKMFPSDVVIRGENNNSTFVLSYDNSQKETRLPPVSEAFIHEPFGGPKSKSRPEEGLKPSTAVQDEALGSKPFIETRNLNTSLLSSSYINSHEKSSKKEPLLIGSGNGAFSVYRSRKNHQSREESINCDRKDRMKEHLQAGRVPGSNGHPYGEKIKKLNVYKENLEVSGVTLTDDVVKANPTRIIKVEPLRTDNDARPQWERCFPNNDPDCVWRPW